MTTIIVFILGLIIGSFLNALIHRLYSGQSIVKDRSRCVHCHHALNAWDLIPLFSFFYLRGKCRYCGKKISWQYPLVEFFTGVVFVLLAQHLAYQVGTPQYLFQIIFASILIVVGIFDFKHYLILDVVVYPALILAIIVKIFQGQLLDGVWAALAISGFFALQYFFSRGRWIGFGDVKLGLFLGMLFGLKLGLIVLFLAYMLGAVTGLVLLSLGKKSLGSRLPFGSFLAISAIIVMVTGSLLVDWYFKLIGL
jgi:prepilin signal peptidase PulO-like enzyme (type II secretory pathway)